MYSLYIIGDGKRFLYGLIQYGHAHTHVAKKNSKHHGAKKSADNEEGPMPSTRALNSMRAQLSRAHNSRQPNNLLRLFLASPFPSC